MICRTSIGAGNEGDDRVTKQELSQLYYLNHEIEEEKHKLEELEAAATNITTKITGMPHMTGVSRKSESMAILIAEQRQLVELKTEQLIIEYNRLNRYIASIEDSQMRLIMSYRFVNGLPWNQVAANIGGNNTADSVKKACYRFLAES
jgi:hypothetical protein